MDPDPEANVLKNCVPLCVCADMRMGDGEWV